MMKVNYSESCIATRSVGTLFGIHRRRFLAVTPGNGPSRINEIPIIFGGAIYTKRLRK